MIQITKENYFGDNKGLSQSKIKDYFKCPNYFYRKNILKTVEENKSKAFQIGSVVDDILTEFDSVDNYAIFEGDRRTKIGKEEYNNLIEAGKNIISQKEYDQIIDVCDAINRTSAYTRLIKEFKSQEIIQIEANIGEHFDSYYGKPDFYKINDNGICELVDLKTAVEIEKDRFYYSAKSYGYFKQLWFYSFLLSRKYPEIKSFEYYILAVEKAEPYRVKLFQVLNEYVNDENNKMTDAINEIGDRTSFDKEDATFEKPTLLLNPKDKYDETI